MDECKLVIKLINHPSSSDALGQEFGKNIPRVLSLHQRVAHLSDPGIDDKTQRRTTKDTSTESAFQGSFRDASLVHSTKDHKGVCANQLQGPGQVL